MTSNFIPMLSSSPPPIDDNESPDNDDEDDAFGMFASADHGFNCSFDNLIVGGNISSENSSPQHTVNLENNSPQHETGSLKRNNIQLNCSFKTDGSPVFSIDKRNEQKLNSNSQLENSYASDLEDEFEDNGLMPDISKSSPPYFIRTIKQHLSDHSSFNDHQDFSNECNHDGTSSQTPLPGLCNTTVPETVSQSETAEPVVHVLNDKPLNVINDKPLHVLNDNTETISVSECKASNSPAIMENGPTLCENNVNGGNFDSFEFCNFESSNTLELANGKIESQPFSSEGLRSTSTSALCSNEANALTCDYAGEETLGPDAEKSTNSSLVTEDQSSLARTDPPDKIPSLSNSHSSEDFDDFKFSTAVDGVSANVPLVADRGSADVPLVADRGSADVPSAIDEESADVPSAVDGGDADVSSESGVPAIVMSSKVMEESDENFGDFESVSIPSFSTLTEPVCPGFKPADDFADFKSSAVESSWVASEADFQSADSFQADGFADFEESNSKPELQVPVSETVISKESSGGLDKIAKVICAVFPVSKENEINEEGEIIFDTLEQNSKSQRLWNKLHDNDQTPGIPFQWGVSHSFQQLLRSVNVDYHSILRTSTVPFFASGLGLLEPMKGPGTKDSNNVHCSDSEIGNSQCPIPPVHFDWGSSGLVNPLDSGQVSSTLMDLSFLASADNTPCTERLSKDFSLENEFLKPESETSSSAPSTSAPILEQILSLNANSSALMAETSSGSRPPNLSEEAIRVLDQLPDISFIKAKVLMFPVSGNT